MISFMYFRQLDCGVVPPLLDDFMDLIERAAEIDRGDTDELPFD